MTDHEWDLLLKQLTRIEKQNDDQLTLMMEHIKDDSKVKKTVDRHSVYFSLMGFGVPALLGIIAKKLGWKT